MPVIYFQLSSMGPVIDAFVSVSLPRFEALRKAGAHIPPPIHVRALLDTGASGTCIDPSVLTALQIAPTGQTDVHTPSTSGTPAKCSQFDVGLMIPHPDNMNNFGLEALPVVETHLASMGIRALIGRDVLNTLQFLYNGGPNIFSIAY